MRGRRFYMFKLRTMVVNAEQIQARLMAYNEQSGPVFKLKNDPRVFSISSGVKSSLDKSSKDLRDKRLLTFDSDKLTRVELPAEVQWVDMNSQ